MKVDGNGDLPARRWRRRRAHPITSGRKRWRIVRNATLTGASVMMLWLATVACSREPEHPSPGTPDLSDRAEEHFDTRNESLRSLSGTAEFQAAVTRLTACLEEAGYFSGPDGILLEDATTFRLDQTFTVTPAIARYLVERARCEAESGVAGLMAAAGVADHALDAAAVKSANEQNLERVDCLRSRGWSFKEPITLKGMLVFEPILVAGQEQAFEADSRDCMEQISPARRSP